MTSAPLFREEKRLALRAAVSAAALAGASVGGWTAGGGGGGGPAEGATAALCNTVPYSQEVDMGFRL